MVERQRCHACATLGELAELVGGKPIGDPNTIVRGVASIEDAVPGDIVFAESARHLARACESAAAAIVVGASADVITITKPAIVTDSPRLAFAKVTEVFAPVRDIVRGIDPTTCIADSAQIGDGVGIGPFAYIGANVEIGDRTAIFPFVHIGPGVKIGADCVVFPHVTILDDVVIGDRVKIHSGTVIGSDGFGFVCVNGQHYKMPQIGSVRICDDVEIGANVTIDRARTGWTEIGAGTKTDNLVHVGHNVKIGRNCLIVAGTAVGGSSEIGDSVTLAGQVGVSDHVRIGSGATVTAKAGVVGDVPAGAMVSGFPARPYTEYMKSKAALTRLPDLVKRVRELETRIARLESTSRDRERRGPADDD